MKKIFLIYGHYDDKSFNAAIRDTFTKTVEENKIKYVEDRCTKMEYQKHFLKVRQAFPVLQNQN